MRMRPRGMFLLVGVFCAVGTQAQQPNTAGYLRTQIHNLQPVACGNVASNDSVGKNLQN